MTVGCLNATLRLRSYQNICRHYSGDLVCTTRNLIVYYYSNAYLWSCCPSSCTSVHCKTASRTISDSALTLTPYVLPPGNKPSEASILVGPWDVCPSWCAIFHSLAAVRNCGKDPMEYLALVRMTNGNEPMPLAACSFRDYCIH